MYDLLIKSHSGLRWVVLLLLLAAIAKAIGGLSSGRAFNANDKKLAMFSMITLHIQLLIGLGLYFMSPTVAAATNDMGAAMKDSALRFWAVEHISMMVIAIALVTIGYSKSKRANTDKAKFKSITTFYIVGLVLVLVSIPWPFRQEGIARLWF